MDKSSTTSSQVINNPSLVHPFRFLFCITSSVTELSFCLRSIEQNEYVVCARYSLSNLAGCKKILCALLYLISSLQHTRTNIIIRQITIRHIIIRHIIIRHIIVATYTHSPPPETMLVRLWDIWSLCARDILTIIACTSPKKQT